MTSQEQKTLNATNPTLTNASLAHAEEAASLSGLKCPPEEIQADVNMIERDEDLTEVMDPTNALPLSSHYYAESTSDASEITFDMRDFQTVHSSKRRKRTLNLAPKIMAHTTTFPSALGNVVVFTPKDPTKQVTSFNSIRLTAELENIAPSSILQIRPNKALNVIAIDTRNLQTTAQLLKRETLLGVPMYAYEPRSKTHAVGVIKDVAKDITEEELKAQLKSTIKLAQLRRLGDSQTVRLTFLGSELPSHVAVGCVRHPVTAYSPRPVQCHSCGKLGHLTPTCARQKICLRCSNAHDTEECPPNAPSKCVNCGGKHHAASPHCPKIKLMRKINDYRQQNGVNHATAKTAVTTLNKTKEDSQLRPQQLPQASQHQSTWPSVVEANAVPEKTDGTPSIPTISGNPAAAEAGNVQPLSLRNQRETVARQAPYREASSERSSSQKKQRIPPATAPPLHSFSSWQSLVMPLLQALRSLVAGINNPLASSVLKIIDLAMPLVAAFLG